MGPPGGRVPTLASLSDLAAPTRALPRHAGYEYSGPCAAWSYRCLDLSGVKRVFVLGPSHTYYLEGCALTTFARYATPYGPLTVDRDTVRRLKAKGRMGDMPEANDVNEHSLEMHMPYLYKRCQETFGSPEAFPTIVPLLVGDSSDAGEKETGRLLLPYLKDPENAFIISSDFCHWGSHFRYTVYAPDSDLASLKSLRKTDEPPDGQPIHETIRLLDEAAMEAIRSGSHDAFVANLAQTHNTVCGRHPIGVAMAALELLTEKSTEGAEEAKGRFNMVQYQRSNLVQTPADFSVSYVSAYAVI